MKYVFEKAHKDLQFSSAVKEGKIKNTLHKCSTVYERSVYKVVYIAHISFIWRRSGTYVPGA